MVHGTDYLLSTVPVADGNWYHVAVTVDRDSLSPVGKFYVDGNHILAGHFSPLPGPLTNPSPLLMGCSSSSLTECYRGALDEVELFPRVLTPPRSRPSSCAVKRQVQATPPDPRHATRTLRQRRRPMRRACLRPPR